MKTQFELIEFCPESFREGLMRKSDLERTVINLTKKTVLIFIILLLGFLTLIGMAINIALGFVFLILFVIALSTLVRVDKIQDFFDSFFQG